jgi:hypothetical protein
MKFAKAVFLVAGIYGVLILTPIYFMEGKIGRDTPPAITHPEYFHEFPGAGLAWQILFLMLSRDPLRYRAMIWPSVLEKVSYGTALVFLFAQHRLPLSVLTIGSVDWIFAALFIAAHVATGRDRAIAANRSRFAFFGVRSGWQMFSLGLFAEGHQCQADQEN